MRGDENAAAMARPGGEPLQYLRARVDAQGDDFRALTELIVGVQVRGDGCRAEFRWGATGNFREKGINGKEG